MRPTTILLAALILGPRLVAAQDCLGNTPFARGLIKAAAGAELGNGSTAIWAGGSLGQREGIFGGAVLGLISGGGESGSLVAVEAGKQLVRPVAGKLVLCPMVRLGLQLGPGEYYQRNFILAAMAAYPLTSAASTTSLGVVGGLTGAYQLYPTFSGVTGEKTGSRELYGLLDLGIAITFHQRFSLIPQLRLPFSYGGRDPSFIIRGSVNLGGSR